MRLRMKDMALIDLDSEMILQESAEHIFDTVLRPIVNSLIPGIAEVWLLTDVTFERRTLKVLRALMQMLQDLGLVVEGIVTPNDFAWGLPRRAYDQLLAPADRVSGLNPAQEEQSAFDALLKAESYGNLRERINQTIVPQPGIAFLESSSSLSSDYIMEESQTPLEARLLKKCKVCRAIAKSVCRQQWPSMKELMFKQLTDYINHQEGLGVNFVVFSEQEAKAFCQMAERYHLRALVIPIKRVASDSEEIHVYQEQVFDYLKKSKQLSQVLAAINQEMSRLHSERLNPFKRSAVMKIEAFKALQAILIQQVHPGKDTMDHVLQSWLACSPPLEENESMARTYKQILNQHLNIFSLMKHSIFSSTRCPTFSYSFALNLQSDLPRLRH